MKKFMWVGVLIFCFGCVTVKIPKYIKEESPYRKTFHAPYDEVLTATTKVLEETGWRITELVNPAIYEKDKQINEEENRQGLILTEVRQTPLFLASRYLVLNVFLASQGSTTSVEIRYLAITPVLFKTMTSHRNDLVVNRIFRRIEVHLKK